MKPLQVLPTCSPSLVSRLAARWWPDRDQRTPMGGRIISLGQAAFVPIWGLALIFTAPMLAVGVATMV